MTSVAEKAKKSSGTPIARPETNAVLVRLVGEAYWKATGEAFYPDKKVIQQVLNTTAPGRGTLIFLP
jgi:hypothetical protein